MYDLRQCCQINTNKDSDTFVGVECNSGDIKIHFPLGFNLSKDDKEIRYDIFLLLRTIARTVRRKDSRFQANGAMFDKIEFPLQAYLEIIYDYFRRGIYREKEAIYLNIKRGKIDWNRTIKHIKPVLHNNNAVYLEFIGRKSQVKENELITQIHKYCIYESFLKIGWLFVSNMPPNPNIQYNYRLFDSVVKSKMLQTNNDSDRELFTNMLAVINYLNTEGISNNYQYGTYRFEYVWEQIIDLTYGIRNKEQFFPKTIWITEKGKHNNACLEPDSIMIINDSIYVLDAKYYKYGETLNPNDLPESTSINKQITYGEYIARQSLFKRKYGDNYKVYNAFLMPFNAFKENSNTKYILNIGEAVSEWKHNNKPYERIQGIVLDLKTLMQTGLYHDEKKIQELALCISQGVENI